MKPDTNAITKGGRRLSAGECRLLERLWREHACTMRAFVITRTGDPVEADEVVAEVFWRASRALVTGMRPRRNTKGWIWQILHHYRIDRARQARRAPALSAWEEAVGEGAPPPSPEELDTRLRVRQALACLPRRQARLVVLRHYQGWDLEAIAAGWNISYGAAKAIHHRAMVRLRSALFAG